MNILDIRKKLKNSAENTLFDNALRYVKNNTTRKAFLRDIMVGWENHKKDVLKIWTYAKKYAKARGYR